MTEDAPEYVLAWIVAAMAVWGVVALAWWVA